MPSEFRVIRFELDEVTVAVRVLGPRLKLSVPASNIQEAHAAPDGTPNALLRYGEGSSDVAISNSQLAACLIALCQKSGIPLPKQGNKSIQVARGHIDLRVSSPDTSGKPAIATAIEASLDHSPVQAV